jgi:hypothetical protein
MDPMTTAVPNATNTTVNNTQTATSVDDHHNQFFNSRGSNTLFTSGTGGGCDMLSDV